MMAAVLRQSKFLSTLVGNRWISCSSKVYANKESGSKQKVGIIGLGQMGGPMAKNLLKNNFPITVFDINKKAVEDLKTLGAHTADGPADLASKVDVVLTMLPTNAHVLETYTGKAGILEGANKTTLLVDSSTIDPFVAATVCKAAGEKGISFVDAPVSGGVGGAQAGTLTFMVGGEKKTFQAVSSVLGAMGANIVHCGDIGSGQAAKICNNMLLGITMLGVSEALNMGQKLGLDAKLLTDIINTSTGRCWSSEKYNPVPGVCEGAPPSKNYEGGFQSQLMCKDLGLAQDIATRLKVSIPLGASTHQFYRLVCSRGDGEKDFAFVYQYLKDKGC